MDDVDFDQYIHKLITAGLFATIATSLPAVSWALGWLPTWLLLVHVAALAAFWALSSWVIRIIRTAQGSQP